MDKEIEDVRAFHAKFDQIGSDVPRHLTKRKLAERANFMLEELMEFATSAGLEMVLDVVDGFKFKPEPGADQGLEGQADALVDLCYVLKGTAAMMGLGPCWEELWDDVQRANMSKVKGPTKRAMGYGADICKPPGWRGPSTSNIIHAAGYESWKFEDILGVIDDTRCADDEGAPR